MTGKNENEELSLADQLAKDWDAAAAGDAEDRVSDNEPVAPAPSGDTPASDDAAVAAKEGETETPAAEPKVDATGRHHGADGKFVPKNPDGTVKTKDQMTPEELAAVEVQEAAEKSSQDEQNQEQTNQFTPPPGWSVQAKQKFAELPAEVKEAIAKREDEVNNGFAKLQRYKDLDPFVEMAEQNGKNLNEVVSSYVAAEQFLERNPVEGVKWLMQTYGVTPQRLLSEGYGFTPRPQTPQVQEGQPPQGHQQPQPGQPAQQPQPVGHQQPNLEAVLSPVVRRLQALEGTLTSQQQSAQRAEQSRVEGAINEFRNDPANVYFENVKGVMSKLLEQGQASGLKDAYEQACWLNPEIRAELIRNEQEAENQKRREQAAAEHQKSQQAAKSIRGGTAGDTPKPVAPDLSLEDDLRRQFDAVS